MRVTAMQSSHAARLEGPLDRRYKCRPCLATNGRRPWFFESACDVSYVESYCAMDRGGSSGSGLLLGIDVARCGRAVVTVADAGRLFGSGHNRAPCAGECRKYAIDGPRWKGRLELGAGRRSDRGAVLVPTRILV